VSRGLGDVYKRQLMITKELEPPHISLLPSKIVLRSRRGRPCLLCRRHVGDPNRAPGGAASCAAMRRTWTPSDGHSLPSLRPIRPSPHPPPLSPLHAPCRSIPPPSSRSRDACRRCLPHCATGSQRARHHVHAQQQPPSCTRHSTHVPLPPIARH